MRFRGLDLNLLVAFDALMELRSVSRAADRLGLSQPAASAALARLRGYFGEELFVVHGKRMYPTALAESLQPQVRACLQAAEAVVSTSAPFDPATAERTFRIIGSDYVIAAVLVRVARGLARTAPGIRLDFVLPDESAMERLNHGEMDLIVSPAEFLYGNHPREELYQEAHVIVGDRDNPLFAGPVTEAAIFAAGHVTVSMGSHRTISFGDRQMEVSGRSRRIEAVVSSFTMLPWMIQGTDRLALMHERLAVAMAQHFPIVHAPLPFAFPVMHEMAQYHHARAADEGLRWLIGEIRRVALEVGGG